MDVFGKLHWVGVRDELFRVKALEAGNIPVSPASPLNAIRLCLFSSRVLSSVALRMVAPRIAALEAATIVKSRPVIPSRTSILTLPWDERRIWVVGSVEKLGRVGGCS